MSGFIEQIQEAIAAHQPLSKEDAAVAIKAIQDAERTSRFGEALIKSGPCLECEMPIVYEHSKSHKARGNEWLRGVIARWNRPAHLSVDRNTVLYNGLSPETAAHYLCESCRISLVQRAEVAIGDRNRKAAEEQNSFISGVIAGTVHTTPHKEFSIIAANTSDEDIASLQAMPYRKFLQTRYWQAIRRYVVYRKKVCDLCYSSDNLNVHHKTYEHHGYEHLTNVLFNDLTLLCRACHAKFHDKLAMPD